MSDTVAAGIVAVQLSDETFVAADRAVVAAVVADPARWRAWWPDLALSVSRDRGPKGQQWVLTGDVGGTAEIYLEPWHDGTIVHLFLRLQLPAGGRRADHRRRERAMRDRDLAWKRSITALKDELENGRTPGTPAVPQVGPGR